MKYFDWNKEKNELLKKERGIGFEEVQLAIESGRLLDTIDHPNQERYPGQKFFVINIKEYAYVIPFVEDEEKVFLKTIIPNRKASRKYLQKKKG